VQINLASNSPASNQIQPFVNGHVGAPTYHSPVTRTTVYIVVAVASGIAAYLLGAPAV